MQEARGKILAPGSEIRPACASIVTCTLPSVLRLRALARGRCSREGTATGRPGLEVEPDIILTYFKVKTLRFMKIEELSVRCVCVCVCVNY
jgi:hypothetical protein